MFVSDTPPVMTYEELIEMSFLMQEGYIALILFSLIITLLCYLLYRTFRKSQNFQLLLSLRLPLPSLPLLLLGGLLLRLPLLTQSFWYDETFTGNIARLSWEQAWSVIQSDVHPPLFYFLEWLIAHTLGSSEVLLRYIPLASGVCAIYLLYRLGQYWSEQAARASALLLAVSPVMVWYSGEARQYTLLLCVILIAARALLERDSRLAALCIIVLPWLHSYGYLYGAALGLYGIVTIRSRYWLLAPAGALLWLPMLISQSGDVADGFWTMKATVGQAVSVIGDTTIGRQMPEELALLFLTPAIVFPFLALFSFLQRLLSQLRAGVILYRDILLLLLLAGVPIVAALISIVLPIYLNRAMLTTGALLFVLVGVFLERRALLWLYAAPMLALSLLMSLSIYERSDMRSFVAECEERPVYTVSVSTAIIVSYYTHSPITVYPESGNYDQQLTDSAIAALGFEQRALSELPDEYCFFYLETPGASLEQRLNAYQIIASGSRRELLESSRVMRVEVVYGSR